MSKEKNKKSNKKRRTLQIGFVAAFLLIIVALIGVTVFLRTEERRESNALMKSFHEYFEREEATLIYFGSLNCPVCEVQKGILYSIASYYNIDFLDIESTILSESQLREVMDLLLIENVTPATVVVSGGKVSMIRVGLLDGPHYVDFLIRAGILEEGAYYPPTSDLTTIDYDEFLELKDYSGSKALVIGSIRCPYSIATIPNFNNIARSFGVEIKYLTTETVGQRGTEFLNVLEEMGFDEELSTPILMIIRNGIVVESLSGGNNKISEYTDILRKHGIIE